MAARLETAELSLLVSLLALEMGKQGSPGYRQRLAAARDKLLLMLTEQASGNGDLPEFGEYARRKYPAEMDEDLVTMVEDLIQMRRQGAGQG